MADHLAAAGQALHDVIDGDSAFLRCRYRNGQPPIGVRQAVFVFPVGDLPTGLDRRHPFDPAGQEIPDAAVLQKIAAFAVGQEVNVLPLFHQHVHAAALHALHPPVESLVLAKDRLIPQHPAFESLRPFAQGFVQVLEGPLVEQVVHLLQGHLVIAQGEAFQQRNRFGKRIIAVPVFRGLRVKQAHFFIVLEQVGGYTHVLGVGPDAVVFGFLIVRHGLNCFPRPAAV